MIQPLEPAGNVNADLEFATMVANSLNFPQMLISTIRAKIGIAIGHIRKGRAAVIDDSLGLKLTVDSRYLMPCILINMQNRWIAGGVSIA